ncbi:hypothetical protein Tco_0205921 [Tanacetum coccineum]
MKRGFSGEHTPLFLCMLAIQAEESGGSRHPSEPQPPPSIAQPIHEQQIPTVTSKPIPDVADKAVYEENCASGSPRCQEATGGSIAQTRFERIPTQPYDSPLPRVNILRSDEGSMKLQELMALCTKLSDKVLALETELRQTKKVYGAAYTKLILKVKKLEKTVNQEDQPEDQLGVFSAAKVLADAAKNVHIYTRTRRAVSTGSGGVSTVEESVSTAGASMPISTAGMVQDVNKDKGKSIMTESEPEQTRQSCSKDKKELVMKQL